MYDISIIVPAHNEERYIKECLESIIYQKFDYKRIQVIMVDDASSDNTANIMKQYEQIYENFIFIGMPIKSGSAGKPRNEALKYATGKYVMFIDADDVYDLDACEDMYNTIEDISADFVTANAVNMGEDEKILNKFINGYSSRELCITDIEKDVLPMTCSACFKIVSNEFIKKNEIHFLEGVPAEDSYFSYSCLMKAKKAYYLDKVIYKYRRRMSESNLSISTTFSIEYFERLNKAYKMIYEEFERNDCLKYYYAYYINSAVYMLCNFIDSDRLTIKGKTDVINDIQWYYKMLNTYKTSWQKIRNYGNIGELIYAISNNDDVCEILKCVEKVKSEREQMSQEAKSEHKKNFKSVLKEG